MTAASLKAYTHKDLAQMARRRGVRGWHSMRKDQLVRALIRVGKAKGEKKASRSAGSPSATGGKKKRAPVCRAAANKKNSPARKATNGKATSKKSGKAKSKSPARATNSRVARRIQRANAQRRRLKDLGMKDLYGENERVKDRVVLMVRDPYWLHVYWELSRRSIERAQAAMAEHWHSAAPTLRLLEVGAGATTSASERVVREIEIHGGVRNWYIDVQHPPKSYRVDIGYQTPQGKFYSLARSNSVTTPEPNGADAMDKNWADLAAQCEKVYALSGGYAADGTNNDMRELFEEQFHRSMEPPLAARYGIGADLASGRHRDFNFEVDAEMIIHGVTKPNALVTLFGEPVSLQSDGTFAVRLNLGNRRQVLPLVAQSGDGIEERTIVLSIERNTKVMEPVLRDPLDADHR